MKKLVLLAIALMLSLCTMLTACGGAPQGDPQSPDTVVIWWPQGFIYSKNALSDALERYKTEVDPELSYNIMDMPAADYFDTLKTTLLGKNAKSMPDIVKIDHVYVQQLAYSNNLVDLTDSLDEDTESLFIENAWGANKSGEGIYALPFDANTSVLFYNQVLFDRAGISKAPENYEEFLDACAKLKTLAESDKSVRVFEFPVFKNYESSWSSFNVLSWFYRNGASLLSEDLQSGDAESAACKDTLKKIQDLWKAGYFDATTYSEAEAYNGNSGMLEMGIWNISKLDIKDAKLDLRAAPVFSIDPNVEAASTLGLYSIGVVNRAQYATGEEAEKLTLTQEKAADVAEYLATNVEFQMAYCKDFSVLPTLKAGLEDPYWDENPNCSYFLTAITKAVPRPTTPAWEQIESNLKSAFNMLFDSTSLARDIDYIASTLNKNINENLDYYHQ
ncbi:MAG: hypothetical protein DBX59_00380 [Bacillota bacterium]|nr:MAG: hypothetical protein DBX59_00380 [Bacillota bacterium]